MTIREALRSAAERLELHHVSNARLTAEVLLAHALSVSARISLHARRSHPHRCGSAENRRPAVRPHLRRSASVHRRTTGVLRPLLHCQPVCTDSPSRNRIHRRSRIGKPGKERLADRRFSMSAPVPVALPSRWLWKFRAPSSSPPIFLRQRCASPGKTPPTSRQR